MVLAYPWRGERLEVASSSPSAAPGSEIVASACPG
jgi:hypothetical protein